MTSQVMTAQEAYDRREEWVGKANVFLNIKRPVALYRNIRVGGKALVLYRVKRDGRPVEKRVHPWTELLVEFP